MLNDYAIVAVPTSHGTYKNFIGQVCKVDEDGIMISFLRKIFDKFIFPTQGDYSHVQKKEIVLILNAPLINKKEQLLFPELKTLAIRIN